MTFVAVVVLIVAFLALIEIAQESGESFWTRTIREAKRRAAQWRKDML